MKIRKFAPEDQEQKKQVHLKAIREVASEDYSDEQIDAWSDFSDYGGIEENVERWVAEEEGELVGFADYVPDESEITGVYVHPDYLRKGIGTRLLEKLERDARDRGIEKLSCTATVTAKKFYLEHGYKVLEEIMYETSGEELEAIKMEKKL